MLTRAEVSAIIGVGAGAFNALPANLPVFGRARQSLIPIDAGGGIPQDNYQSINKVDYRARPNTQASVRYAFLKSDTETGTQSASPYPRYNTGVVNEEPQHQRLGHAGVVANNFTSQTKLVWNRLSNDQPVNGPSPSRGS